jgi:hypothetical protein
VDRANGVCSMPGKLAGLGKGLVTCSRAGFKSLVSFFSY